MALAAAGAVLLVLAGWLVQAWLTGRPEAHHPAAPVATDTGRFSRQHPIAREDLETLRWEEMNQLLRAAGADPKEVDRLILLSKEVDNPPASYLRAMLLLASNQPEPALAAFGALDPKVIPATLLYAPFRLHETLRPADPGPYLPLLRQAVAEDKAPPLVRARLQARDGRLADALASYLRTDPQEWAGYDLESLRRIGTHQGLAMDLRRLVAGALASGRVDARLASDLRALARGGTAPAELEAFERKLKQEIDAGTPAGKVAVESARKLAIDRETFLARNYRALIDKYRAADPPQLPTETALALFLSAVALKEPVEMDRWGQELKRRHGDAEVREWVNAMKGTAR